MIRIACLLVFTMVAAKAADIDSLLTTALSAQQRGDFPAAENAYNAAFELAPRNI